MANVADSRLQRVPHTLAADVQVWWVDLEAYAGNIVLGGLCTYDHARAAGFADLQRARQWLASRHALRQVLGNVLGCPPDGLVIEPDEFGKPQLVHESVLAFNLSHSGGQGLIGVASTQAIGLDIELVHGVTDAETLTSIHFTEAERAEWSHAAGELRDRDFLRCWTRKEACVKALGVGLMVQPDSVEVGCAPRSVVVDIPIGAGIAEVAVCSLQLPGEAVGALAVAAHETVGIARRFFCRLAPTSRLQSPGSGPA
jgi:4'-phosphopantetheinyl transferase